ncbi:MAG: HNH endonuclease signature motif containing protein [Mycobacteriaceae bacterium]
MKATRSNDLDPFWSNVEPTGFCWLWTGKLNAKGYGSSGAAGESSAHRAAYTLLVGPIPEGLTLDHLCRVRRCVNPDHLEPVTQRENLRRIPGNGAWFCSFTIHPETPENVRITNQGATQCRACLRAYSNRPVECAECAATIAAKSLWRHRKQVHEGIVFEASCPECGKSLTTRNLARHRLTHAAEGDGRG